MVRAWKKCSLLLLLLIPADAVAAVQVPSTVRVEVRHDAAPVADAEVLVNGTTYKTDADGAASASVAPGAVDITVVKDGFAPLTTSVTVTAGQTQVVLVDLQGRPAIEEEIIVSATRTGRRLEDQPVRQRPLARVARRHAREHCGTQAVSPRDEMLHARSRA